jgi:hypothetical protein
MGRLTVLLILLGFGLSVVPACKAQNAGEFGAFGDYFRLSGTNYVGVGAMAGINVASHLALDAEMSYDFAQDFTNTYSNGGNTTFVRTSVRPLSGLFGPQLQVGTTGPFRAFVTGKIGFLDISNSGTNVASSGTFSNAVAGVGGGGTHLAFLPGGGLEAFFGPIGLRVEAGDDIYLNNGTHNSLRITFGPTFRF